MTGKQTLAGAIFLLYFLLGTGYSLLMPMWEGPDEPAHYQLARFIATTGKLPSPRFNYEAYQPLLYYSLASLPLRFLNQIDPNLIEFHRPERFYYQNIGKARRIFDWNAENYRFLWGPQLLRWMNLAIGGMALWFVYRAGERFTKKRPSVALAALALAALNPQYLHISASIGNDALSFLAGAVLFWMMSAIYARPPGLPLVGLAATLALVLPVVTKLTVLPMSLATLALLAWQTRAVWARHKWKLLGGAALLAGGLFAGLAWLAPQRGEVLLDEFLWRGLTIRPEALSLPYLWRVSEQVVWSYWGKVGWLAVGLPGPVVVVFTLSTVAGVTASLFELCGERKRDTPVEVRTGLDRFALGVLGLALALALLMVAKNGLTTPRNQGRFLFPSIGVIALLTADGWAAVLPDRAVPYLPHLIVLIMLAANLLLWFGGIIPVYYQPFLD